MPENVPLRSDYGLYLIDKRGSLFTLPGEWANLVPPLWKPVLRFYKNKEATLEKQSCKAASGHAAIGYGAIGAKCCRSYARSQNHHLALVQRVWHGGILP